MESVMASVGAAAELIVVDDHSQDDSVAAVTGLMEATDWFPTMLLARAANGGVGAARNFGIARARSDRIFMLDADNLIYPTTLATLSAALDAAPDAAFSYGIIAKVGQPGLLSHLPWDVQRLTVGNYIDAMAMIRRSSLDELEGYDAYFSLRGWEDYDYWLRLAAVGGYGTFVPEFVGSYRVHATSRQQTVGLDTETLIREFRERYPFLPWHTV
jgi:glycosyltransferase involved in cell wall biosynthesis